MESCIILDETYLMLHHHDSNKEIKIFRESLSSYVCTLLFEY